MTPLGRLLMRHNAVVYGDRVHFVGGCSKMSVTEFLSWARTVEFGCNMFRPDNVGYNLINGKLMMFDISEKPSSNVIQFPAQNKPCDVGDD